MTITELEAVGESRPWPDDVPETALINYPHLRGLSLVFVLAAVMLHTIDSTIANVALPHMQGSLSANVDQISWVITGYIMAAAIATPSVAWLSDRFGLKRVLIGSTLAFTATSALCGLAISLSDMVFYRILQGMSGAALIPLGQTVLLSTFKQEELPRAMSLFGLGIMFGPIIGPTLGGYITEYINWRWVFFVNIPIGLMAAAGLWFFVKERAVDKSAHFDGFGFVALVTAVACLQLVLDRGEGKDWFQSWEIISLTVLACSGLYLFVLQTKTARQPLFAKEIFTNRNFIAGNIVFFIVMGNMITTAVMVPTLMQNIMGYPVLKAGLLIAPRGIGMMIAMVMTPLLSARIDDRLPPVIGIVIASWALWQQATISIYFSEWQFVWTGFWQGFGLGMVFVQMSALCFSTIPDHLRLHATTVFNISRNTGAAVSASVGITLLTRGIQINSQEIGESVTLFRKPFDLLPILSGITENPAAMALLQGGIARQAAFISYINNFMLIALVTLIGIPLLLLIKPPKPVTILDESQ